MNEGKDRLNLSHVEILHSKLLPNIININIRFTDGPNSYHFS